ncbi:MAG TPA: MCP four helix bundle domain-containing protein, partial [Pararobbsia sp.]|nr:MCP four helix bundle domain-containing protein [Pararobbsia sp.]
MSIAAKRSIGRRLAGGFAVVLILLSGVGAVGLFQASRIYDGTHKIADHLLPSVEALGSLQGSAEAVRRLTTRQLVSDDPKGAAAARVHHGEALAKFAASLDDYAKLASSPEEHAYAQNIKNAWASYLETDAQIEALSEQGEAGLAEARTLSAGETVTRYN